MIYQIIEMTAAKYGLTIDIRWFHIVYRDGSEERLPLEDVRIEDVAYFTAKEGLVFAVLDSVDEPIRFCGFAKCQQ